MQLNSYKIFCDWSPNMMQMAVCQIKTNQCEPSECSNATHKWKQKCPLQSCFTALKIITIKKNKAATEPNSNTYRFNRHVCVCSQQRDSSVLYLTLCEDWAFFLQTWYKYLQFQESELTHQNYGSDYCIKAGSKSSITSSIMLSILLNVNSVIKM